MAPSFRAHDQDLDDRNMVLARISEAFSMSRLEAPRLAPRLVSATVSPGEKAMEIALRSQLVRRPFGFLFWHHFPSSALGDPTAPRGRLGWPRRNPNRCAARLRFGCRCGRGRQKLRTTPNRAFGTAALRSRAGGSRRRGDDFATRRVTGRPGQVLRELQQADGREYAPPR